MSVENFHSISGQMALALVPSNKASFDNYYVGDNIELVAALRASVQFKEPKMVYFYGPAGSGKSHLLFSAMRFARDEEVNTSYLSLRDDSVNAEMLSIVDVNNLVYIDNVDAWAGDEDKERALFTLFEQIKHASGQLIVSSSQDPESTEFFIRDLQSRLSSGLIYPLHRLTEEQLVDVIKMRSNQRGLEITDNVVMFLLRHFTRDVRELFDMVDKIDKAAIAEQRRITVPFIQTLFAD